MDILIAAGDLEQAPRVVKDWLVTTLARQLALTSAPGRAASGLLNLAEISVRDAATVLETLRNDYLACQVLLEFGRDNGDQQPESSGLHRLAVVDALHHLRLSAVDQLVAALNRVAETWSAMFPAGQASLFALDEAGNLYVSKATQASLKSLWHQLVTDRYSDLVNGNPTGPSRPIDGSQLPGGAG